MYAACVQLVSVPGDTEVSLDAASHIELMVQQRLNRMPLQYIVNSWDFHRISVKLVPPVFIPRPETEVAFYVLIFCPVLLVFIILLNLQFVNESVVFTVCYKFAKILLLL